MQQAIDIINKELTDVDGSREYWFHRSYDMSLSKQQINKAKRAYNRYVTEMIVLRDIITKLTEA